MPNLTPITLEVRTLDPRIWDIFNKEGPLTNEELAYLDDAEAAYLKEYPDEQITQ
jgi:hypothetical protein